MGGVVAAWDVTVVKTNGSAVKGRTFTNFLSLNMGGNGASLNAIVYVVTNDGYIYKTDFNGMDPFGFIFFANNRGLVNNSTNMPLYQSVRSGDGGALANLKTMGVEFHTPNNRDSAIDKTYKIFFDQPAADLPSTILPPKAFVPSKVENFRFVGDRLQQGYVGQGGYFYFDVKNASSAQISIDLSSYKDANGNLMNGGIVTIDNAVVITSNTYCFVH